VRPMDSCASKTIDGYRASNVSCSCAELALGLPMQPSPR
jgi:hypothetical protein